MLNVKILLTNVTIISRLQWYWRFRRRSRLMNPTFLLAIALYCFFMLRKPGGMSARRLSCFSVADWLSVRNVS